MQPLRMVRHAVWLLLVVSLPLARGERGLCGGDCRRRQFGPRTPPAAQPTARPASRSADCRLRTMANHTHRLPGATRPIPDPRSPHPICETWTIRSANHHRPGAARRPGHRSAPVGSAPAGRPRRLAGHGVVFRGADLPNSGLGIPACGRCPGSAVSWPSPTTLRRPANAPATRRPAAIRLANGRADDQRAVPVPVESAPEARNAAIRRGLHL